MPLLSEHELGLRVDQLRKESKKIGFTCGVFDLIHPGHVRYLRAAKKLCDFLIVALNDDASARRHKGAPLPLVPGLERAEILADLRWVDAVVMMPDDRPLRLLELYRPDFYIKGGDYAAGELKSAKALEEWGGGTQVISVDSDHSSRQLRSRIRAD
ncbi:MAG: adenylyltransferase/cytidyltransferase family protein [Planctomycetota bacterium]